MPRRSSRCWASAGNPCCPVYSARCPFPKRCFIEIAAGATKDPNAARLASLPWAQAVTTARVPESVQGWGLGRGESEVLAIATETTGTWAILDDLAARRCARFLGVPVVGTGKILVLAKHQGLIGSVREQIDRLLSANFRLSERLIERLLREAGEVQ